MERGRKDLGVTGLIEIREERKKGKPNRHRYYLHTAPRGTDRSHRTRTFSRRNVPFIAVPVRAKKRLGRTSQTQLRAIITRSFTTPLSPLVTASKEQNGSSVFYKKEAARHSWWRPPRECLHGAVEPAFPSRLM